MAGAGLSGAGELIAKIKGMIGGGGATVVGLSIGSSSIKIIELKKAGNAWKLLHFGIVQIPDDVIVNREIVNPIAIVDSIKTLINQIKLNSRNVCASVSGTSVIFKRMTVDVPNPRETQEAVFWEAEQYLPFDVSQVYMDYHVLSRGSDNKTDLILIAAKKALVDTYMSAISDSGLVPKVIDIDFFAMQNLFELNYPANPSEAVALVDLGASATKIVVVDRGVPVFTKDSALGGRNITAEIQRNLNLNYADAETLKVGGQGGPMPQEVSDLLNIGAENFATEIKRALDFYSASSTGAPVAYVLLSGGSAKIPNISKVVEDATRLPTQVVNPFNAITYDPSVFTQEYLNAIAPLAAVPIGLAIRAGAR